MYPDEVRCPVCALVVTRDGAAEQRCGECGWLLWGGLVAGAPSVDDEADFATALDEACWRRDQLAVEHVAFADDRVGPAERDWLDGVVRGRVHDESARDAVAAQAAEQRKGTPVPWPVLHDVLARLVRGEVAALGLVEFDVRGIRVVRLHVDADGEVLVGEPLVRDWVHLLPGLPADEVGRFILAGGVGTSAVPPFERDIALPDWIWEPGTHVVTVRRVTGWRLLDRLAAAISATDVALADTKVLVDQLTTKAPARDGYDLAVVAVGPNGAIELSRVEVFAPGTVPGEDARRVIRVYPPPYPAGELLLPLVRGGGWAAVTTQVIAPPAPAGVDVTFALTAPGRPRVASPDASPTERVWAFPAAGATGALDLVCVVELGGPAERVTPRLARARRLVDTVAQAHPLPRGLRVGLVGYADHDPAWRPFDGPEPIVTRVFPLGLASEAGAELAGWTPDGRWEDPRVAAVEDALHAVAGFEWRPNARRVVVITAWRPPHASARNSLPGCPAGIDWTDAMAELARLDVCVLALLEAFGAAAGQPDEVAEGHAAVSWRPVAAVSAPTDGDGLGELSLRLLHEQGLVLGAAEEYPPLAMLAPNTAGVR